MTVAKPNNTLRNSIPPWTLTLQGNGMVGGLTKAHWRIFCVFSDTHTHTHAPPPQSLTSPLPPPPPPPPLAPFLVMKFELYLLRNNIHTVFPRGSLLAAPPLTDSPAAITEVWSEFLPRLRASEEPVRDRGDNCLFPGQGGGSENRGARGKQQRE